MKSNIIGHVVYASPDDGWFYIAVTAVDEDKISGFQHGLPCDYDYFDKAGIVLQLGSEDECKAAVIRAKAAEKMLRPMWQQAIEQQLRIKSLMHHLVLEAAKGRG